MNRDRITFLVVWNRIFGGVYGALILSFAQQRKWVLVGAGLVGTAVAGFFHIQNEVRR